MSPLWPRRPSMTRRVPVGPRERVLASADTTDGGVVAGTRDALYLLSADAVVPERIPWEQVENAEWRAEEDALRVTETASWGDPRRVHLIRLAESSQILQLLRERITASVLLQRRVAVHGSQGFRVIARRAPRGDRPPTWFVDYDRGVAPDDPAVVPVVAAALAEAKEEMGVLD